MLKVPIHLNCHFFKTKPGNGTYSYKIDASGVLAHPFQLFKLKDEGSGDWENLSVYATVEDAVRVLLKELLTCDLADEIIHGQATVNPAMIMEKIQRGDRSVSLYSSAKNAMFRPGVDINFQNLVEKK